MIVMGMSEEKPVFQMESEEKPSHEIGDMVDIKAKVVKKSEYQEGDKVCYVCEYEVESVGGKATESKEEGEDVEMEEPDDMEELNKVVDEEMTDKKEKK